ncbi:hypothetical protein [Nocardioides perillae]|uniref:Uncharacterized protein n=1 Tax=Nocardioides perillae TaxID=1119534 RepID=A0A7Y9RWR7_9ACTN|nr:hypothetical protein [Nocardioides perillae]NYG56057.1 hypothetical protein [Nocardioides perillae]
MSGPRAGLVASSLAVVLAGALAGCSEDRVEAYCEVVAEEQSALVEAAEDAEGGGTGTLLAAYDSLERMADAAPGDVAADWDEVVLRVGALRDALADAGVDPATYDPEEPPEGLGADEREAVTAAAVDLVEPTTLRAVQRVEQQVLDVCGAPLGL